MTSGKKLQLDDSASINFTMVVKVTWDDKWL